MKLPPQKYEYNYVVVSTNLSVKEKHRHACVDKGIAPGSLGSVVVSTLVSEIGRFVFNLSFDKQIKEIIIA